ncbi:sal-like protein 1 [Saccostrea echinata]|uniref:sal-like protein 1 n=1 Tax=Saccostrea echinata TaxID=191078 RepID=UPI002A812E8A|nr:sal-like protein 1 [Saccostrea echinata]
MSRRKQPKPRHIEAEDELASILQNDPEPSPVTTSCPSSEDAHVCGKCREEFLGLEEFLSHKKVCSSKVVLVYEGKDSENTENSDLDLGDLNPPSKVPRYSDPEEYNCGGSDGEGTDYMDNFDDDENEIMDAEDQEIANEEIDEDLMKISMMNAAAAAADEEISTDSEEDEENNNTTDSKSEEKCSDDNKEKTTGALPGPLMFPFSQFLPTNSNVTLEPMNATRAAVAQFAENNLAPAEIALLHSTLFNLQQQQILQLQLIQQLQLQVNMGGTPTSSPLPFLPPVLPSQSSSQEFNNQKPQRSNSVDEDSVQDLSSSKEDKPEKTPETSGNEGMESKPASITASASPSPAAPTLPPSLPLSGKDLVSAVPPPTSEFAKLTKLVERSQYVSDDPFFRHKCRLCQKVFGSDSALQIHIRSHTGERPFKCNICGNRFTTRGNLKVHFERHKAKYPHVKMNPHPVPEHLDKIPSMPLIGSPFPTTPTPPLPLPGGMFTSAPPMSISSMMSSIYSNSMFGPRPTPHFPPRPSHSGEQSSSSAASSSSHSQTSPTPTAQTASEAPVRKSPNVTDTAVTTPVSSAVKREASSPIETQPKMSRQSSQFPLLSPVPSVPPPPLTPSAGSYSSRDSILPTKLIDHDESLEQYMEIDRSETSKLQQLVDNLENKVSDPNQCVICHRVLSCKSALQMHYRIHTGERPYKCKICGRAFTTKGNLKTHMGVHRMKPPIRMMHQCPVCHKSFTNLLVLQQHIRSHASLPGMPPMPDMSHFKAFGNFQRPMEWGHRPFDLSFRPGPERELDLSKTSPTYQMKRSKEYEDEMEDRDVSRDMDDDYNDEQNRSEGELRQNDSGRVDETNEDGSDGNNKENNIKDRPLRPDSTKSDSSKGSARSASPNTDDESNSGFHSASLFSPSLGMGPIPPYNTSLAALEERVRAIDSSMASHRYNPFGLNGFPHPQVEKKKMDDNGDVSDSEENGSADDSKPGTPALSVNSDGGNSINGFMMSGDKLTTTCNICYKTFACRSALDIHYRSHTKERPFKCEVCDRSFTTKGNMKQHMLTHKIRDLPNSFNNNSNSSENLDNDEAFETLENSNDSVTEEKKTEDQPHKQGSPKVSESNNQERQSSAPFVSSSSGSNYTNNGGNVSNGSQDNSPFLRRTPLKHQCQVCQKGFSSASALQIHIRTHTGDKPFKCTVCGKAFTTKGNLKVHMGTHMWNNSPSRRGRRMSIEPPFMMTHKENPYMQGGFPPRAPDFFPFQFPPFMNGVPPHKMNEISVIQSLASGMGHMPPLPLNADHLTSPRSKVTDSEGKAVSWRKSDTNGNITSSGELDLSMKTNTSTSPKNNSKPSPTPGDNWNSAWKTMCHLCNQNFPSPTALEYHLQNFHLKGAEPRPKSIVA